MKVFITGAGGQLAHAAAARMQTTHRVVSLTRAQLDVTRPADVVELITRERPDVIINGAAYNDVDGAEDAPATAMAVNAFGVRTLARAAAGVDATLVHFGTDFVFDGTVNHPYAEDVLPNPQSVYAMSKLLGEWFACESRHYILRVESLFGGGLLRTPDGRVRGSTLDRIADAILAGEDIRAFTDRTVTPSYVEDVVDVTSALLTSDAPYGIYHCVGSGMATWMDAATYLAAALGRSAQIIPVRMASLTMKAKRPQYCALSNAKLRSVGIAMPTWEDALSRYARARLAQA
jgi:dTDP-4-dehydrorhamnose reductase